MALEGGGARGYTASVDHSLPELARVSALVPPQVAPARALWVLADDSALAAPWSAAMAREGLAVACHTDSGADASEADALVLFCSRHLPEVLGQVREWRARDAQRPLVVVCAAVRELDQVLALEMGADDVIDASLGAPVVAARLRALWRRCRPAAGSGPEQLGFGRLSLHLRERRVQLGTERVPLTECEFEVLWLLASQAGRAVSRAELLERLRGLPYQRIDRSIDCRVYRIRAKLRDTGAQHLRTVRNCGYLFSPARW
jgi:two-component system, OmpR family, response regulator RstA